MGLLQGWGMREAEREKEKKKNSKREISFLAWYNYFPSATQFPFNSYKVCCWQFYLYNLMQKL